MDPATKFNDFCLANPSISKYCAKFKRNLVKAHKMKQRIQYLKMCKREQLLPESSLPKRLRNLDGKPFGEIEKIFLQHEIGQLTVNVRTKFQETQTSILELSKVLPDSIFRFIVSLSYDIKNEMINNIKIDHIRKKQNLIDKSLWNKKANVNFSINLTNKEFDKNTKAALGYGLNFSGSIKPVNPVKIMQSIGNFERNCPEKGDIVRGMVYGICHSEPHQTTMPLRFINALNNLKKT